MSDDEPHDTPSLRTPHPSEELQRLLARALREVATGRATIVCGAANPRPPRKPSSS